MQLDPSPYKPARLSLTPLIDVVFILLLFFILTSQLNPWHRQTLAQKTYGEGEAKVLRLAENGQLWDAQHPASLQAWSTVGLLVDGNVSAQMLLDSMQRIRQAGTQTVTIVTGRNERLEGLNDAN